MNSGAVLVDIRPAAQRAAEGEVPGAFVVERNVLEWRLDPSSEAALPVAAYDLDVIILCQEGFTSSLAAESLLDLGLTRATDVDGGFQAWRDAGLSWSRTVSPTVDELRSGASTTISAAGASDERS
jgi:rhodanese-related sulfurtransferase